jgi:hypothetical protein
VCAGRYGRGGGALTLCEHADAWVCSWQRALEPSLAFTTVHMVDLCDCHGVDQMDGATPLFVASQNGHAEVVRALVELGGAVNQATVGSWGCGLVVGRCEARLRSGACCFLVGKAGGMR